MDEDRCYKNSRSKKSISDYDMILSKIAILADHFNLSFAVIESDQLWDLLRFVYLLGQKKSKSDVEYYIKRPSHSVIREKFIETAKIQLFQTLNLFL